MFGLISKKKLLEILEFLYENNDPEKLIGETAEARVRNFYFHFGVANAVNYIGYKLNLKRTWLRKEARRGTE